VKDYRRLGREALCQTRYSINNATVIDNLASVGAVMLDKLDDELAGWMGYRFASDLLAGWKTKKPWDTT